MLTYKTNIRIRQIFSLSVKTPFKAGSRLVAVFLLFVCCMTNVRAFSLLGPYQSWMTPTNGFQLAGDIGGPMNLGEGYRWNVPVLTYSFDQSFLDFYGSSGVAAVESAIQILNNLPPASQINLNAFPFDARQENYRAAAGALIDLKSETLFLLLQQLGLAQPQRFMYCIHGFSDIGGSSNAVVVMRSFDPFTFVPTNVLNGTLFTSNLIWQIDNGGQVEDVNITAIPVDPVASTDTAVADGWAGTSPGCLYTGLTRDDAGGLRYLLQTNNYNLEALLPGVQGAGTNANNYVNLAVRGGVDKITFVYEAVDQLVGMFYTQVTNQFTDTYVTNGHLAQQQLQRVISQPDFLFSAAVIENSNTPAVTLSSSTGTTNWINNALAGLAGPGVIQPPVKITFNKIGGRQFYTSGKISDETAYDQSLIWGTFDATTNAPVSYPEGSTPSGSQQLPLFMFMYLTLGQNPNGSTYGFQWNPVSAAGTAYAMQTSTNLSHWTTLFTVTNNGGFCTYFVQNPASSGRFYRFVSQ